MAVCIRVQPEPFDMAAEVVALEGEGVGAVVTFNGLVRNRSALGDVSAIELEHYPAMTVPALEAIAAEAQTRWPLLGLTVIHRIGHLMAGDPIVLVAVWSAHRKESFEACRHIMEELKSTVPFWKKERLVEGDRWVEKNRPGY